MLAARFLALALCIAGHQTLAQSNSIINYADDKNWLCRPDMAACATNVRANEPAVDCFYIQPDADNAVRQSAERFAQLDCRVYIPLIYQGEPSNVQDAWRYYLTHDNDGRGLVLIGFLRGAPLAKQLLATDIDGKPAQARLISAVLLDTETSTDQVIPFKNILPCYAANQIECVIGNAELREIWNLDVFAHSDAAARLAAIVNEQMQAYLAVAAECACKRQQRANQ